MQVQHGGRKNQAATTDNAIEKSCRETGERSQQPERCINLQFNFPISIVGAPACCARFIAIFGRSKQAPLRVDYLTRRKNPPFGGFYICIHKKN